MNTKRFSALFRHGNYSAWILYGLSALLVLLLQTAPRCFPAIFGARPLPIVLFVVCVAVLEGGKAGAVMGALSGLLWGVYSFRLFGFDALVLMVIGLTAGLLVEWLLRANFFSALLLCSGGVLLQALIEWIFCYAIVLKEQPFAVLLRIYLPNCLYTVALTPLIYWMVLALARFIRRKQRA